MILLNTYMTSYMENHRHSSEVEILSMLNIIDTPLIRIGVSKNKTQSRDVALVPPTTQRVVGH